MASTTVREPARDLPVAGDCDVLVAGGGMAGVAAAVAARRQGARVCLLERYAGLGGLATLGNVIKWLPICDGDGHQVIAGLGEELLRLSVHDLQRDDRAAHFAGVPPCWEPGGDLEERQRTRFATSFNPASYIFALEKLVVDEGVDLLYDTRLCELVRDGDRITHAIIENKSGRQALAARAYVDATGDADLCCLAEEATESLDSNVLTNWFYYLVDGKLHLDQLSNRFSDQLTREHSVGPFFRGDDGRQVSGHILASRKLARRKLAELRQRHAGSDVQVFAPTTIANFRATRRLVGTYSLQYADEHRWFDDAIGLLGSWRKASTVWAIPWRCLCAVKTPNLAVAGRCISAEPAAWEMTRVIPGCVVTGQAAGVGAAMACREPVVDLAELEIAALQGALGDQGVLLDPELVVPRAAG